MGNLASTVSSTGFSLPGAKSTYIDPNEIMKLNNTPANLAAQTPGGASSTHIDPQVLMSIITAQERKRGMIPSQFYQK